MRELRFTDPDGVRFVADEPSGVGVLTLAGSSGRVDAARARLFAGHGALAESIRWFGGPGQSPGPVDVPLELFLGRVQALRRECDRVVICGTSFGAEAALLTAAHSTGVHAAVGFAPSDLIWGGVSPEGETTSHWTSGGRPLPFVPFVQGWQPEQDPPSFTSLYRESYAEAADDVLAAATIPVERIPELVLVAGGGDQVWPSPAHASRIAERRRRHGLATVVVLDEEAGHRTILPGEPPAVGGVRMARGGTEQADRRLGAAAWPHLQQLLST